MPAWPRGRRGHARSRRRALRGVGLRQSIALVRQLEPHGQGMRRPPRRGLAHDTGQLGRAQLAKMLRAGRGVVAVGGEPAGEAGTQTQVGAQDRRGDSRQENGLAPVQHRHAGPGLAQIVEERRLAEEALGPDFETVYRGQDVEPVPALVTRQCGKRRIQDRAQHLKRAVALDPLDPAGAVTPELLDSMHGTHQSPSIRGRPQRSLERRRSKKSISGWKRTSSARTGATSIATLEPASSATVTWPSQVRTAGSRGTPRLIRAVWGRTTGRLKRLCGLSGVKTRSWTSGLRIGPPSESE